MALRPVTLNPLTLAAVGLVILTLLTSSASADPSRRLNPTRPKAFDYAADAELVVGKLNDNFSCDGREYGYYADQTQRCQVFHICMPVKTVTGRVLDTFQFSFFCPDQTRFSQDSKTCISEAQAYPCSKAHTLYDLNKAIGHRPKKKKQPINPKDAAGGNFKFGPSDTRKKATISDFESTDPNNFSSDIADHEFLSSLNTESPVAFGVQEGITPVHTDAALTIGAPAVAVPSSAGLSGSTTNFAGRPRTTVSASNDLSESFEAPDSVIPPGSQIISTTSLHHQNLISDFGKSVDFPKSSVTVPSIGISAITTSSHGTAGFSNPRPSTISNSLTSVLSSTTETSFGSSYSPLNEIEFTTAKSFLGDSDLSLHINTQENQDLNSINVNNRGRGSFSTIPPQNPASSSGAFRPIPQRNPQSFTTTTSSGEPELRTLSDNSSPFLTNGVSNSHTLEAATVRSTNNFSSTGTRAQVSTFASRAREALQSIQSNTNRPQFSTQSIGNSRIITTNRPVITTQSTVTPSAQPFTPFRQTEPPLVQHFTPPPAAIPVSSGPQTPLRIPGFSPGVSRTGGGIQNAPSLSFDNQKQSTLTTILTTTEYNLGDDEFQTVITTELPLEQTTQGFQINNFGGSNLNNFGRSSFNEQSSQSQSSTTGTFNRPATSGASTSLNNQRGGRVSGLDSITNQRTFNSGITPNVQTQNAQSNSQRANSFSSSQGSSSNFNQISNQQTTRISSTFTGSTRIQESTTPTGISTPFGHQVSSVSAVTEPTIPQSTFGRVVQNAIAAVPRESSTASSASSVNAATEATDSSASIGSSRSIVSSSFRGQSTSDFDQSSTSRSFEDRGPVTNLLSSIDRGSVRGIPSDNNQITPTSPRTAATEATDSSSSIGSSRSTVSSRFRGQSTRDFDQSSTSRPFEDRGSITNLLSAVDRGSARGIPSDNNQITPTTPRAVTRNRGSKKFQPSTYLLQSAAFNNPSSVPASNQNNALGSSRGKAQARTTPTRSRANNQNVHQNQVTTGHINKLQDSSDFDNTIITSSPNTQQSSSISDRSNLSASQRSLNNNGITVSDQSINQISTGITPQVSTASESNKPSSVETRTYLPTTAAPFVGHAVINSLSTVATSTETSLQQVSTPVNSRGRTFESRGSTTFQSSNTLSTAHPNRSRGRGNTATTTEASVTQHGFAVTSSQNHPFTRLNSRQRGTTAYPSTVEVETTTFGAVENIASTDARKVIKKKIIVNGRPGSRGSNEATTTPTTEEPQGTNSEQDAKSQRALDALARFSPTLANANLLSFRLIPNKPKKNEGVTPNNPISNLATTSSQRGTSSRISSSTSSLVTTTQAPRVRSRGSSRRLSTPVTSTSIQTTVAGNPTPTTNSPFQRTRSRGRQETNIQDLNKAENVVASSTESSIPNHSLTATVNTQRGNTKFKNQLNNRRRVLKKVTPLSDNGSEENESPLETPASSDSESSLPDSSRSSTGRFNSQSSSSVQASSKPSGRLRVVGTSIESSVSSQNIDTNNSGRATFSSSSSSSRPQPRAKSNFAQSRTTPGSISRHGTTQEPLTDLELEALSALTQASTGFESRKSRSQRITKRDTSDTKRSLSRSESDPQTTSFTSR